MAFEIHRRKHIEDDLVKTVRKQLGNTVAALTTSRGRQLREAVHESRKSVKKVRAVASLLKGSGAKVPRKDRRRLKQAGRALSRIRDTAAIVDTFDRLHQRYPKQLPARTYATLRRALLSARDQTETRAQRDGLVGDAVRELKKTRASAKSWTSGSITSSEIVAIVGASYRRSRRAMQHARWMDQSAAVHSWRKALKTLWYQLRLAKPLTTGVAPLIADLRRLETALGDDHNLVILAATLRVCPDARALRDETQQIDRLAARMREPLRRRAFALGYRVHRRAPAAFARWLRASFKTGHRQPDAA